MNTVLLCIPLKDRCLEKYEDTINEMVARESEYREMLKRYDIYSTKVWVKSFSGKDYALVYHEVGPDFPEKIQGWENSSHHYDQWLNERLMAVSDEGVTEGGATQLIDFIV